MDSVMNLAAARGVPGRMQSRSAAIAAASLSPNSHTMARHGAAGDRLADLISRGELGNAVGRVVAEIERGSASSSPMPALTTRRDG
jgi:hypothetical protein